MSGRRQDVKEDIGARLQRWSLEEMHFRPQGRFIHASMPKQEDYQDICRGQMVDIWEYIINHVRSKQTVKTVMGNLNLQSQQAPDSYKVKYKTGEKYSHEKDELLQKRSKLASDLKRTQTDIDHVERDLKRLQGDILDTEQAYQETKAKIQDVSHRTSLLTCFSHQCEESERQYEEYTKRLSSKIEAYKKIASKEDENFYSKKNAADKDLESGCARSVRQTCEVIGQFLHDLLGGEIKTASSAVNDRKERLWTSTERIASEYPANQILVSLINNTQDANLRIREKTESINIKQDAEKLRFKYETNGRLTDLSTPPNFEHSLSRLLEDCQLSHINRFVETEKLKNGAWKVTKSLESVKMQIEQQLSKMYIQDPGALELARKILQLEFDMVERKTILRHLESSSLLYREQIAIATKQQEILLSKFQRIQDFKKLADNKQNLIRVLVKHNTNSKDRLTDQKAEILEYVHKSLSGHHAETTATVSQLHDGASQELELFASVALPYLMYTLLESGQKKAVLDMSIHRLANSPYTPGSATIQRILQKLEFPIYKSPECMLSQAIKLKWEVDEIEQLLVSHSNMAATVANRDEDTLSTVKRVTRLCEKVKEKDSATLTEVMPLLKSRLERTTKSLEKCVAMETKVDHWWEQPGQDVTPWVKVDNMTLQQWKDQWTVTLTKLRQLQMQKTK
ncbi:unnamed protein product [Owenia fusiformis]|uniref:Uncharacterized protein n=1 Tax=Owenia fusiformis TaxID=6347 RepID=A0A8J1TVU7_OWEFU|nr:unnamed protein product [Owenia fusiformis]